MTTHQVKIEVQNMQVQIASSDGLLNVDSEAKATGVVEIALDTAIAKVHTARGAIQPSHIRVEIPNVASTSFPLNTRHLLPILQPIEIFAVGEAVPSTQVQISPEAFLALLGKDPVTDVFDLNETDSVFTFGVTLHDGTTATILTTHTANVLAGDTHPTLPSIFNWLTGEVDLNFIDIINPLFPVQIQHQYLDPVTGTSTVTAFTYDIPYESEDTFSGQTVQAPVFPTSISITALAKSGVSYTVYDEPVINPATPEITQGLLLVDRLVSVPGAVSIVEKVEVGTIDYATGEIDITFPEEIEHQSEILLGYAKLLEVIRYVPRTQPPVGVTITIPVEDWDRIAVAVETALTNLETAIKYRN